MPGGRPTKYKPEYARMAYEIIRNSGFSISKLAKVFDVNRDTLYNWMDLEQEFSDSLRQGRKIFDGRKIEKSLVRRATGYRFTETYEEPDDNGKMKVVKKVRKTIPPDVAAIKHWQVNMYPETWKEKQEIGFTDKEGNDLKWVTEVVEHVAKKDA